jgi:putative tricarboxylic transport membrane protein
MRAADLTTALLLMAGGIVALWDSLRLGIGWGTDGPRSGFFPFWLAVILLVCCGAIVVQAIRKSDRRPFVTRAAVGPVLKVLVPATVFVVLIRFRSSGSTWRPCSTWPSTCDGSAVTPGWPSSC